MFYHVHLIVEPAPPAPDWGGLVHHLDVNNNRSKKDGALNELQLKNGLPQAAAERPLQLHDVIPDRFGQPHRHDDMPFE